MDNLPNRHRDCSRSVPSTPCEGERRKLSRREQSRCPVGHLNTALHALESRTDFNYNAGQVAVGIADGQVVKDVEIRSGRTF